MASNRVVPGSCSREDLVVPEIDEWIVPAEGCAVVLRFDGESHVLYLGEDETGADRFATKGRRIYRWGSPEDLDRDASAQGWILDPIDETDASRIVDLELTQAWLRGATGAVDPDAALTMWNITTDVAHSLGVQFRDRGNLASRCYDKLFAANLPWVFGRESYVPRWTPQELRVLRRVLNDAVHVLRMAFG